jgi:ubiquinone/menaquinone biosynthesis C-methylase UbiE
MRGMRWAVTIPSGPDPAAPSFAPPPPLPAPPSYDLSYRDVFWATRSYEDRCDRIALRALLPPSGDHLVDLGAGFGRLVDEYRAFRTVTLVDASPEMVRAARERVAADPRVTVARAEATRLPLPSASVDVVVCVRLLLHFPDPAPLFAEIERVLRPGGCLVLEFPNRRHLLAVARYLALQQAWSPFERGPFEYLPDHVSHQPMTVIDQLREAGLEPDARRSVSLFRSARLTRVVGAGPLAAVEARLQAPLGGLLPGPSVYVRALRPTGAR